MSKEAAIALSSLLQDYISSQNLRFPVILDVQEFVVGVAQKMAADPPEARGYIVALFEMLQVLGAVRLDENGRLELRDEIHAATAVAVISAIGDGVTNVFDFSDSEDVENPYYGSWFLYQIEKERLNANPERSVSRICQFVTVLVKARIGDKEAVLLQHDGNRAWGKYKLIGGRLRPVDNGDFVSAARREVQQEVRTKTQSAQNVQVAQLSSQPLEYTVMSRRLGAYTLYRVHVFECTLELPDDCLKESFSGEKGRETTWFPIDQISGQHEAMSQSEVMAWIKEKRWLQSCQLSTNKVILGGSATLRTFISTYFNNDEIVEICLQMDIDYENLSGAGKEGRIIALIGYCERRARLDELEKICRNLRPNVA